MTGVREFGRYFEEFVMDYLKAVRKIELIEMEYPYKIPKKDYINNHSAKKYPGDIDLIGLSDNKILIVECKEDIGKSDVPCIKKKFKDIEKHNFKEKKFLNKKIREKNIKKIVAYIHKTKNISENNFHDIKLLSFKDIIKELMEETKKESKTKISCGRYHWLFKKLQNRSNKNDFEELIEKLEKILKS